MVTLKLAALVALLLPGLGHAINDNNAMVINSITALPAQACGAQPKIDTCMKMRGSVGITAGVGVPSLYSIDELAFLRDTVAVAGITPSVFTGNGVPSAGTAQNSGTLMCYVLDVDAGAAGTYNFTCEMAALTCNKLYRYHFAGSHTTAGQAEHSHTNTTNTSLFAYSTPCVPAAGINGADGSTTRNISVSINRGALPQTMSFEYGTTTAYGSAATPDVALVTAANSGATPVSVALTGLTCNTTYHYRFNSTTDDGAVNGSVTSNGADNTFTNSCNYTVGGSVSGLATGSSVVLRNNGGDDLTVSALGNFTFATGLPNTSAYNVTVQTQPTSPGQTCTVSNGTGSLAGSNVTNVAVACVNNAMPPSAPQNIQISPNGSRLVISWGAPVSDGGSPITGYTATLTPGGLSCSTAGSPPATTCTINGISPGSYTVNVTANNAAGAGAPGAGGGAAINAVLIPTTSSWALILLALLTTLLAAPLLLRRQ